ncbi:MAG TPA: cyclopropane-fatty-acyl-phospholipid synthase family protein [Gammaproteobacteria bacterium]|nr:cyclopropane-fatty-acyl-phospholipid synthase family protein [Gammaproteobacteria bacterium]
MRRHDARLSPSRQRGALNAGTAEQGRLGPAAGLERTLVAALHRLMGEPPIRLLLWDGYAVGPGGARYSIEILSRGALYRLLRSPNINFGELYSAGRVRVHGDLSDMLVEAYRHIERAHRGWPAWLAALWGSRGRRGADLDGARHNIQHHYDLGNDFYRLWLDGAAMQYTCAYFESPDRTLEQAQLAKLEHVCRKLRLRPGQEVIEAGCGWGGLARYMAQHHGVRVRAFNISREQLTWARERAAREGLADRVEFVEDDYRNITGRCDRFVSVGMLEHVGPANYAALAGVITRTLKPDGLGLVHTIGRNRPGPVNGWIEKRIFPGSYVPSITELMRLFEDGGFSVLDVENLRLHYARTLEHWRARYLDVREQVQADYDEHFARAWELYLAGARAAFVTGTMQLFQVVFAPAESNSLPATRRDLYA